MKISDLIKRLNDIKQEHGDLEAFVDCYETISFFENADLTIDLNTDLAEET